MKTIDEFVIEEIKKLDTKTVENIIDFIRICTLKYAEYFHDERKKIERCKNCVSFKLNDDSNFNGTCDFDGEINDTFVYDTCGSFEEMK